MKTKHRLQIIMLTVFLLLAQWIVLAPTAWAQTPFYEGKNVLLLSGTDAGGSGDLRTRAVIPVLKKHIPGHPNIVVQYMPGAGGRKAANHMYKSVRPDGLTIGAMLTGMVQGTIFGEKDVLYELDKFIYLGSHARYAPYAFLTRKAAGFNTRETLTTARGVRIGAPSVGHSLYTMARLFAYMLDMKEPRLVTGYTPREIDIALERNEVDARVSILDSLLTRNAHWLDKDLVHIHATIDIPKGFKHSDRRLAKLPEIESFARSNQDRRLIQLFRGARDTGQPFVLPPGTPAAQVKILREAMGKAFADPEYIKGYEKLTAEPAMPMTWEEFETELRELPREAEIIDLFKKLSGPAPLPARPSR
jgi:tripartite-type tricarboxylate transporter receptor subunit TctC